MNRTQRLLAGLGCLLAIAAAPAPVTIVVCAPGYPGDTVQAAPTMEAFARAAERAAGREAGSLAAIYYETAEGGLARLRETDAAGAIVPLPFLLRYGEEVGLRPRLGIVRESGPDEVWSLVAKRGQVASPASLEGWEVTGMPGYAPEFVRRLLPGAWGDLPAGARITFTPRVLSALRRAAAGENVAAILDREQAAGLAALPFGGDLEVVARSKPVPGQILCSVRDRLDGAAGDALLAALLRLHETPEGAEALKAMRMSRFERADTERIEAVRAACAPRAGPAR